MADTQKPLDKEEVIAELVGVIYKLQQMPEEVVMKHCLAFCMMRRAEYDHPSNAYWAEVKMHVDEIGEINKKLEFAYQAYMAGNTSVQ